MCKRNFSQFKWKKFKMKNNVQKENENRQLMHLKS